MGRKNIVEFVYNCEETFDRKIVKRAIKDEIQERVNEAARILGLESYLQRMMRPN